MWRAILDTNVLISASLNAHGAPAALIDALRRGEFHLVLSEPILAEYRDVISRPRLDRFITRSRQQADRVAALLAATPILVEVGAIPAVGRDPKDAMLFATARAGGGTVIVSRDEDVTRDEAMLRLCTEHGIAVMTVRQFLATLAAQQP